MNWIPIDKYDSMTKKPKNVVFLAARVDDENLFLQPVFSFKRHIRNRKTTHALILIEPPSIFTNMENFR